MSYVGFAAGFEGPSPVCPLGGARAAQTRVRFFVFAYFNTHICSGSHRAQP